MFEEFLKDKHAKTYFGLDDDMPDAFDYWLSNLNVQECIDFADEAIVQLMAKNLGSIKSPKKAESSRLNGKKGGRPKTPTPITR